MRFTSCCLLGIQIFMTKSIQFYLFCYTNPYLAIQLQSIFCNRVTSSWYSLLYLHSKLMQHRDNTRKALLCSVSFSKIQYLNLMSIGIVSHSTIWLPLNTCIVRTIDVPKMWSTGLYWVWQFSKHKVMDINATKASSRGVKLTTHHQLVVWSRKCGYIHPITIQKSE
jgi:hypothetical protein